MLTLDANAFLAKHWQREPLLVRGALPGFTCPLTIDELWALAASNDVESRLITKHASHWSLEHGPFDSVGTASSSQYQGDSTDPFTLLVQAVDHHSLAIAALLEAFKFIPRWRIDDVMISVANKGGGVGPHNDNYDVFLLQGQGQRRWRWGSAEAPLPTFVADGELSQVSEFTALNDHILSPGDMLYLPPGVPHWGEAESDDCVTLSIGFRAPSKAELLDTWAMQRMARLDEQSRYTDPKLSTSRAPGAITADDLAQLRKILLEDLDNELALANCLGELMTAPKYNEPLAAESGRLLSDARLAYFETSDVEHSDSNLLFANGLSIEFDSSASEVVKQLCTTAVGSVISEQNPFFDFLVEAGAIVCSEH